jgi:hypothetical protein
MIYWAIFNLISILNPLYEKAYPLLIGATNSSSGGWISATSAIVCLPSIMSPCLSV